MQSPGGRGDGVFVADKLFISIRRGGALKISNFITCLYRPRTFLEVNYLFHMMIISYDATRIYRL